MQILAIFLNVLSVSSARQESRKIVQLNNPVADGKKSTPAFGEPLDFTGQTLHCYDELGCPPHYGSNITIGMNNAPDLSKYPYYVKNRIKSCMFKGIYLLYEYTYYNKDHVKVSVKVGRIIVSFINMKIKLILGYPNIS